MEKHGHNTFKENIKSAFYTVVTFLFTHSIAVLISAVALITAAAIVLVSVHMHNVKVKDTETSSVPALNQSSEEELSSKEQVSSEEEVSSEEITSSEESVDSSAQTVTSQTTIPESNAPVVAIPETPSVFPTPDLSCYAGFNANIENNVFLDALVYTGYNLDKHRADGLMWVYILCSQKRAKGWLSNITYNGGPTGYEVNAEGKPDISYWERTGLVCATYAAYVYYNYLPNVAGIDTSMLARPDDPKLANDWYKVGKKWIAQGYSQYVPFNAYIAGNGHTVFSSDYDIPLGSLIILKPKGSKSDYSSHVCIYAGKANGYHWVTHVGNENGPEFCAIERMSCGPDPQEMLAVITTPNCLALQ